MAGRLLDEVEEDPAHGGAFGEPGNPGGQGDIPIEVVDLGHHDLGPGRRFVVEGEGAPEALIGLEMESGQVAGVVGRIGLVGAENPVDPALLGVRHVLDQPTDGQGAGRGRRPGLVLGQPVGGVPNGGPLLGQEGQEALAFVRDGGNVHGHGWRPPGSRGRSPGLPYP